MSSLNHLKYYLTFLLLLTLVPCFAQDYVISVKHWGVKEGLSHRQVNAIYQDRKGYIWITTSNGLNRFDGYSFSVYTHESSGIPDNFVENIAEDGTGMFWGSSKGGPFVFDPVRQMALPFKWRLDRDDLFYLEKLKDGSLIMTSENISRSHSYSIKTGLRTIMLPGDSSALFLGLVNGKPWLQSRNTLYETDLNGTILRQKKLPSDILKYALRFVNFGVMAERTAAERFYFIDPEMNITEFNPPVIGTKDYAYGQCTFPVGVDDLIWDRGRVVHLDGRLVRDFTKEGYPELAHHTRAARVDDKGRIWIGNDQGIYLLTINKGNFRKYFYKPSSSLVVGNGFRAILEDGKKLIANNDLSGPLSADVNDETGLEALMKEDGKGFLFFALIKLSNGNIAGSREKQVFIRNREGQVQWYQGTNNIWSLTEMPDKTLLVGTEKGLEEMDLSTGRFWPFRKYNNFPGLSKALVLYVLPDRNGAFWICASNGFYSYDPAKGIVARYSSLDTGIYHLPSRDIQHFVQDPGGIFWIASKDGLIRWDRQSGSSRLFTTSDGLSNNNITGIVPDDHNRLWLSSDYGLMCFDTRTFAVHAYLTPDGTSHNEFNRISSFKDQKGNIYFGSLNGITAFNPDDFPSARQGRSMAPLVLNAFRQFDGNTNKLVNNTPVLVGNKKLTLYPEDRFFALEVAMLTYDEPEKTTYYWKIEGAAEQWTAQADRTLRFSKLPYSAKALHIRAQASNGTWSKNDLVIPLEVVKPFYLRWWVIASALALVTVLLLAWFRWRTYRLKRDNIRLESTVRKRTADLQVSLQQKEVLLKEIHHRVKNNLQVISSMLQLQSGSVDNEVAKAALLEGHNRVRSIALVHHKLYENDDLGHIELSGFIKELHDQIADVFRKQGQRPQVIYDIPETYLDIDTAIPLGLIINELITNAYKYGLPNGNDSLLQFALEQEDSLIHRLTVSDNGPGIPEGVNLEKNDTLGLRLIRRLSKQLRGRAEYHKGVMNNFVIYFKDTEARMQED
jgi:two-component sensor histidine kinase/streptogramin lyase